MKLLADEMLFTRISCFAYQKLRPIQFNYILASDLCVNKYHPIICPLECINNGIPAFCAIKVIFITHCAHEGTYLSN